MNVLEINLKNIIRNIEQIKSNLKPNCLFCAVVKANAYGLGAKRIAHATENHVDYFAVSRVDELVELRKSGITKPILVMACLNEKEVEKALNEDGEIQVESFEQLISISKVASKLCKVAKIHLKFNTGMNRYGFNPNEANEIKDIAMKSKNLRVKGVFSHLFHSANIEKVKKQNDTFSKLKTIFKGAIFHLASTDSCYNSELQHDMIRVGLGIYVGKHPAISLESVLASTKKIEAGESVGYSSLFVSSCAKTIGVFQMGYADGFPRAMKNGGHVLLNGEECSVLAVCMDATMIDITNISNAKIGDSVKIIGKQIKNVTKIVEMAEICDTITYEILTGISNRTKRKYVFR